MTAVVILIVLISLLWLIGQAVVIALLWGQQERSRTRLELLSRFSGVRNLTRTDPVLDQRPDRGDMTGSVTAKGGTTPESSSRHDRPLAPREIEKPENGGSGPSGDLTFPPPLRRQPPVPPANQPLPSVDIGEPKPPPRTVEQQTSSTMGGSPARLTQSIPSAPSASDEPGVGLPPGSVLPDFELRTIDGERFRRSQLAAKRRAILFLAPESPGSSAVLDTIRSSQVRKRSLPDLLLVIDGGAAPESLRRWLGRLPKRVTVLVQEDSELATVLRAPGTPSGYLLDGEMRTRGPLRRGARAVLEGLGVAASQMTATARRSNELTPHAPVNQRSFTGLPVGTPLPEIRLPLLGGGEWERTPGRPTLLILWDSTCSRCDDLRDSLVEELPRWQRFDTVLIARGPAPGDRSIDELKGLVPIMIQSGFETGRRLELLEAPAALAISGDGVISRPPAIGAAAVLSIGNAMNDQATDSPGAGLEPARS